MSDDDRTFERRARAWLELGPVDPPEPVVQAALLTIESTSQERDLRIPWRFPTMTTRLGLAAAAVLGVLAVGLMYIYRPGNGDVGASQPPSTPPPTPTPAAAVDYSQIPGWIVFEYSGKAPDGSTPAGVDMPHTLWLAHMDGSNVHELAPGLPAAGKGGFDISPDGKKVVFDTADLPAQIWEVGIEGGDPRLLTTDCSGQDGDCLEFGPAYSPTGLKIAIVRAGSQPDVIAIRDLITDQVTMLESTRSASREIWLDKPSWSPDGQQLVYSEVHHDAAQDNKVVDARLFIVNADGSGRHELTLPTDRPFGDADWSPDGSRIVFSSYPIRYLNSGEVPEVYSVRPDGTDFKQLTSMGVGSGAPSWTSDGAHIFFWGYQTFYLMDPDGLNSRAISPGLRFDGGGYGFYGQLQPTP